MTQRKLRVLIHPVHDRALYLDVLAILDGGVRRDPDAWEQVTNRPSIIDHWGYHSSTRSLVVLSEEPQTFFYRLSIVPGEHEVFDRLARVVIDYLSPDTEQ